jgi:squalene monooxygenase
MTVDITSREFRNAEKRIKYHEADVLVVGAGVFGCAMAYAMAKQGRSVILLERQMKEPDRIVGELLHPGGVEALKTLGLENCLEGIDAIPCYGYSVNYHDNDVMIPYPPIDPSGKVLAATHRGLTAQEYVEAAGSNGHAENASGSVHKFSLDKPEGRSFHHGRFIMQLRRSCDNHPNVTIFETEVTNTIRGEHTSQIIGVETMTTDKTSGKKKDYFFGRLTIIADGYNSRFRKHIIHKTPIVKSKFYALKLIDCPMKPKNFGHVFIGKAFPILMYQISTHETRALIDVPEKLPEASSQNGGVRGYIRNIVIPTLPEEIKPAFEAALADGRIPKSMPNSWLPPARQKGNLGVVILGDAYNMRHPLTGGGMTVAFNDVVILSELLHPDKVTDLGNTDAIKAAMNKFHWQRKSLSSIINVLAMALYMLFTAQDRQLAALQRGCFVYFEKGLTDEPCAMLGGILHRPSVLAFHFFAVAFLSIRINAIDVCGGSIAGIYKIPRAALDAALILWKACVVFLPVMWQELQ